MAKSSVLSHPTNDYFSRCFTWQVAMCEGNICAAHILNYMEYSSNTFLDTMEKSDNVYKKKQVSKTNKEDKRVVEKDNNGMPIIPLSYSELSEELIYQFGRNQIIDAIQLLVNDGYLNPSTNENSTDRVNYYSLNLEPIKKFIDFWELLTDYRKDIMTALISFKNNKKKSDSTVYFQTIHRLILNDASFNIKLSTVYFQTMQGLILTDVYNVLRLIKTLIKTNKNIEIFEADPDNQDDSLPKSEEEKDVEKSCVKKEKISFLDPANVKIQKFKDPTLFFTYWETWLTYKKEIKNTYKSESSEQTAVEHLFDLANGELSQVKKIIEASICNGWKGLFEYKTQNKAPQAPKIDISDRTRYEREDAAIF